MDLEGKIEGSLSAVLGGFSRGAKWLSAASYV